MVIVHWVIENIFGDAKYPRSDRFENVRWYVDEHGNLNIQALDGDAHLVASYGKGDWKRIILKEEAE